MGTEELSRDYLLDKFTTCMAKGFILRTQEVGHDVWPSPVFHPIEGHVYTAKHFFPKLHRIITKLEKLGYEEKDIAYLFRYPSKVVRITYLFHVLYIAEGLSKDEKINIAIKLLRYLTYLRKDPFVESGKNLIFSDDELNNFLKDFAIVNLETLDQRKGEIKKYVGRICALLWTHCELLYFCHHQLGHETHGPYVLNDGRELIVRDYYDLKPEPWEMCRDFPFSRIVIITIHENANIRFDYSNRMYSSRDLTDTLTGYSIFGWTYEDLTDTHRLKSLYLNMKERMAKYVEKVSKFNKTELMKKFSEVFFYSINPLCEAVNESWKPPKEFYEDLENQSLSESIQDLIVKLKEIKNLPDKEKFEFLKSALDPRNY